MEKVTLEITDRRFNLDQASRYDLTALLGPDGCSLLVADAAGEALALKAWHFFNPDNRFQQALPALRRIFGGEEFFKKSFASARPAVFNEQATLLPNRLFNPSDLPTYFNLLLHPEEKLTYFFDDLPELEAKLVFALDSETARLLTQYFPERKPTHTGTALLRAWHKLARRHDYEVFANLRNGCAQVAVFDRKHLLFYNAFHFAKASDFLYFLLLAYDQQRLNPLEVPLTLSGEIMLDLEHSELYKLLFRYVRDIRCVELPEHYQFPGAMQALPGHFNFDLYSLKMAG